MTRLFALLLGIVLASAVLVGWLWIRGGTIEFTGNSSDAEPAFGFHTYYELPKKRPDDWCGTDNGGPSRSGWIEGPHDHFERLSPNQLALDSVHWFERSPAAAKWRENPTARLELTYPSGSREITVRYAATAHLSWEQQLRAWFERYPPGDQGLELADGDYNWTIDFGTHGSVRGSAASDTEAIERMRALVETLEPSELFQRPSFALGFNVRPSPHVMNCYSVTTESQEQLDELPKRLREQRSAN